MDIRTKMMLDEIRHVKTASNSVIAGGAARDYTISTRYRINVPHRDIDIFVPQKAFKDVLGHLKNKGIKTADKGVEEYRGISDKSVFAFEYEGEHFDLISANFDNEENFGDQVIGTFDYGLCMVYYDGLQFQTNKLFESDIHDGYMTLTRLEDGINSLPKAMERFQKLNDRFSQASAGRFKFRTTVLEYTGPKEEYKDRILNLNKPSNRYVKQQLNWDGIRAAGEIPLGAVGPGEIRAEDVQNAINNLNVARPLINRFALNNQERAANEVPIDVFEDARARRQQREQQEVLERIQRINRRVNNEFMIEGDEVQVVQAAGDPIVMEDMAAFRRGEAQPADPVELEDFDEQENEDEWWDEELERMELEEDEDDFVPEDDDFIEEDNNR